MDSKQQPQQQQNSLEVGRAIASYEKTPCNGRKYCTPGYSASGRIILSSIPLSSFHQGIYKYSGNLLEQSKARNLRRILCWTAFASRYRTVSFWRRWLAYLRATIQKRESFWFRGIRSVCSRTMLESHPVSQTSIVWYCFSWVTKARLSAGLSEIVTHEGERSFWLNSNLSFQTLWTFAQDQISRSK